MLTWIIVAGIGSAALAVWAHERYYSYKYAALRERVRARMRDRGHYTVIGAK